MTHAVSRGEPTRAQLFLESKIKELIDETGRPEDRYSISKIVFKCMRDDPQAIRQIDGATGEKITNGDLLRRAIAVALSLKASGFKQKDIAVMIGKNHINLSAAYYGAIFQGVIPFLLDPVTTKYEMEHFFQSSRPALVFVEAHKLQEVKEALENTHVDAQIVSFGNITSDKAISIAHMTENKDDDKIKAYWPVTTEIEQPAIFVPTSGSTGPAKAAVLTHNGLVAQLPTLWTYFDTFPTPTEMCFLVSTAQWMTLTIALLTTPVYRIPLLSSSKPTPEHTVDLIRQYKPTWGLFAPPLMAAMLDVASYRRGDFHSLQTVLITGGAVPENLMLHTKEELSEGARVSNGYGMTELQGFISLPGPRTSLLSVGTPFNITLFKIIDDDGHALGPNQEGELCFKSEHCIVKGYFNNDEAYSSAFTEDGWFKTGDKFYMNEAEELFFVNRIKFSFKYGNHQVSPEELEDVICAVRGVQTAVVCGLEAGPAALVVPRLGAAVSRTDIHDAVREKLNEFKQLRGGIAFVESLPQTNSGKTNRFTCKQVLTELSRQNKCY